MIKELKNIVSDAGVMLFFVVLPVVYPLLYSWIYNNEVVRDVPIAVVDDSHSARSREFINLLDASPDVCVAYHCADVQDARSHIGEGNAYGIIYIPREFDRKIGRMEQAHVSVYCDMSYMMTYKAIFGTATAVAMDMGAEINKHRLGGKTQREIEVSMQPLAFDDVPLFNSTGGYGNFIIPAVLLLIIQQAMLLGVGMIAGTEREKRFLMYRPERTGGTLTTALKMLSGKTLAYVAVFSVMTAWCALAVPRLFGFVSMVHGWDLALFLAPYLLACIFFALTFSELVRYRESVMLIVVFTSVPILFLSGVSWPESNIPGVWQGVGALFPSTYGIRGFVRMNSMGAVLADVEKEYVVLWIQAACYALTAFGVMCYRVAFAGKQKENNEADTIL